ncbi:hypothetical protein DXV76_17045 [Rhodobacteraceae bacterium CCMM004]|nr:hypothetical protein DXV76_17045 [Rhodobacteraceae bacterium CCMM004]
MSAAPFQSRAVTPAARAVALTATDFPDFRPSFAVAEGDRVAAGQPLFADRHRPDLVAVAPVAGTVARLALGARRRLAAVEIAVAAAEAEPEAPSAAHACADEGEVRAALTVTGLWPHLRAMPYGGPPDPAARPDAVLVLSPDPAALADSAETRALERGLAALGHITDGPVYLCQAAGPPLVPASGRVRVPPPQPWSAGQWLAHLRSVADGGTAWVAEVQDVAALGRWCEGGVAPGTRAVRITLPDGTQRRHDLPLGADLTDVAAALWPQAQVSITAGTMRPWRPARWLGLSERVVALSPTEAPRSAALHHWGHPGPAPLIPLGGLDRHLPPGVAAVPLLRALSTGDAAAADRLGARDLIEEDVAPLSVAGPDAPTLLRRVLNDLRAAAA